jgi:hypothetical protein
VHGENLDHRHFRRQPDPLTAAAMPPAQCRRIGNPPSGAKPLALRLPPARLSGIELDRRDGQ